MAKYLHFERKEVVVDESELIECHLQGIDTQSTRNEIRSKVKVKSEWFILHPDCVRGL